MTEHTGGESITQQRLAIEAMQREGKAGHGEVELRAWELVDRVVAGEPFEPMDFVFAATLGRVQEHSLAAYNVMNATNVGPNEVIGTVRPGVYHRLEYIGVTRSVPAPLSLESATPASDQGLISPHYPHRFRARLDVAALAFAGYGEKIVINENPAPLDIFEAGLDRQIPLVPTVVHRQLLAGPNKVLEYVLQQDPRAIPVVGSFIAHLAARAAEPANLPGWL